MATLVFFLLEGCNLSSILKVTLGIMITIPFITYFVTSQVGWYISLRPDHGYSPPTLPYMVPFIRNLPRCIVDAERFFSRAITWYGARAYTPVRVYIAHRAYSFISGPAAISTLFKNSKRLVNHEWLIDIMLKGFGLPQEDARLYEVDDTGYEARPNENAKMTNPANRVYYLAHRSLYIYLSGPGLEAMARHMTQSMADQISQCDVQTDCWTTIPDLYTGMVRTMTFKATVTALCGAHIFTVIPDLEKAFWDFDNAMLSLPLFPTWMIPRARRARDHLKQSVSKWHRYAEQHYDTSQAKEDPRFWEEYFGNKIMRMRNMVYHQLPLSDEGYAAEDLGLIWASNANAIPATFWLVFEIVRRPELLTRVRQQIAPYIKHDAFTNKIVDVDVASLCHNDLLQSAYAEVLRLRVAITLPWTVSGPEFNINGYSVKEGETLTASTWHAGRDEGVWNTGTVENPHPVDEFWAERFLVKPNDVVQYGPMKKQTSEKTLPEPSCPQALSDEQDERVSDDEKREDADKCTFSLHGTTGSWIPYGGGIKLCPGRHFSKQEIIVGAAMLLTAFDIELTEPEARVEPDKRFFMFGTMPPVGQIGAKIRRRAL